MKHRSSLMKVAVCAVAIITTGSAVAEEEPVAGKDVKAAATTLESVTVTARRHAEDAQPVPISMTVLEGKAVDDLPTVSSNAAIARTSPNFSFVDNGGHYSNVASIRGVGSLFVLSPDDTSVPFYVDEVPLSALSVPPSTLDMSRIEVLRGPQGTLYGRNSQGGAVNFVPNRPEFFRTFQFRGEAGSNGWGLGEVIANAPFGEVLAGRLALQYSKRDGDVRNLVAGGKDGKTEVGSARGSLLFAPDADASALLTFSHHKFDDTNPLWVLRDAGCYTHARLKSVPEDTLTGARSGNRLTYVPQWSGTVGGEYRIPGTRLGLGSGQFYANAAYEYVGARATDLQNSLDVSSYGLVNARIGWQGKTAGVYLFANNLTDKKYEAIGANYGPGAEAVRSGGGRTVGIGATLNF